MSRPASRGGGNRVRERCGDRERGREFDFSTLSLLAHTPPVLLPSPKYLNRTLNISRVNTTLLSLSHSCSLTSLTLLLPPSTRRRPSLRPHSPLTAALAASVFPSLPCPALSRRKRPSAFILPLTSPPQDPSFLPSSSPFPLLPLLPYIPLPLP